MTKNVITVTRSRSIKDCIDIMAGHNVRRTPVVNAEGKLSGIVTATDVVNYFGGGEYYKIILNKHRKSIYSAFNEPVSSIMTRGVIKAYYYDKLTDALEKMIKFNVGGLPVVLEDERVVGIITEADVLRQLSGNIPEMRAGEIMSENLVTVSPDMTLKEVAKVIISEGVRRLPILTGKKPIGIISTMDIVRYLSSGEPYRKAVGGDIEYAINIKITDIASTEVISVKESALLEDVLETMLERNIGGVLVVDEKDELKGIITERDLLYTVVLKEEMS